MSGERFFSEREFGARIPDRDEVEYAGWAGVLALVRSYIGNHRFAESFPTMCSDRDKATEISGTDESAFWQAARAWVPELPKRLLNGTPETAAVMDFIEFLFDHVADCELGWRHEYFHHHHLRSFDRAGGRARFRADVNLLLKRNSLAFELGVDGRIVRLGPPVVRERLNIARFDTGDEELDALLRRAVDLFRSPDPPERRDSLEKLWDAYERLKSIENPVNKQKSIELLIASAGLKPQFNKELDAEMRALTGIGNSFRIRHSEVNKVQLETSEQVDYLFARLFALIWLFLQHR